MFFAEKWNDYVNWSKSKYATNFVNAEANEVTYLKFKNNPDQHGNIKAKLTSANEIKKVLDQIDQATENSLIFLPFDQSAGILTKLISIDEIKVDFSNLFDFSHFKIPDYKYACIHIRRGDCTEKAHPNWYVNNKFYLNLISLLHNKLPDNYFIHICTQGVVDWIEELTNTAIYNRRIKINTTSQLFINDEEVYDFFIMQNSTILFCAGSSFSHTAAYSGKSRLIFDADRGSKLNLCNSRTLLTTEENWRKTESILDDTLILLI